MKRLPVKFITIISILIFALGFISIPANAQSLSDIQDQINKANAEKVQREKELTAAKNLLSSLNNQSYSVSNNINTLKTQIEDLEKQINDVKTKVEQLDKNIADTQSELTNQQNVRENEIKDYFANSYRDDPFELILSNSATLENYQTMSAIKSYGINVKKKKLDEVMAKVAELNQEKQQVELLKQQLESKNTEISQKKVEYEAKLKALASSISATSSNTQKIQGQLEGLKSNLSYLNATQKKLLDAELAKLNSTQQTQQVPIQDGQYFFMGRGRDLIEGHGLGMSQWGMYGMAQNYGWKYDQILTFYYTNTTIGDYAEPNQIVVDGKTGPISFQDYLAGIGEVPNDWPIEAIKAQVVAARTYAMRTAYKGSDGYMHICGTDACQVYNGGTGKLAAAQATAGKVILYNGQPIVAYYSASHRGCSSKISDVWGSSDLPYIQSVKDDAYAYKDYKSNNPYNTSQLITTYNWQWRTNGYTLAQLSDIFSKDPSTSVGTLQRIDISKDQCGRVSKITLVGSNGQKSMTGWTFRATFNDETPYDDFVYSTEFMFYQK